MFNTKIANHYTTFCSLNNLKNIRSFVETTLVDAQLSITDTALIVLAVDEICSNSIIHGNKENPNSLIDIDLKLIDNEVVVEIKDKGTAFNYYNYKDPSVTQLITSKSKGNMGLMMVRSIMDKIEYEHSTNSNTFRLRKKI
jgi:serine/threonine-protein kinase RsbW